MILVCWLGLALFAEFLSAKSNPDTYAPGPITCPSKPNLLREADSICPEEAEWVARRHAVTNPALLEFLEGSNLVGLDVEKLLQKAQGGIPVGLAFSGGSYRSMLEGAGQLAAMDKRMDFPGGLGGLLQSATYVTGLSGSAWLLGTQAVVGWPTIQTTVLDNPDLLWNFTQTTQLINTTQLYKVMVPALRSDLDGIYSHLNYFSDGMEQDVKDKKAAGFRTSFTDYWGRGLSRQMFTEAEQFGKTATWSGLRDTSWFKNHEMPFPVIVALAREPGSVLYGANSTIVEMTPFELGSFDSSLNAFTDIKYLGTNVTNGVPQNSSQCVSGYDNVGFLIATSSSIFNQFLLTLTCDECKVLKFPIKNLVRHLLKLASRTFADIAVFSPNPFFKSQYSKPGNMTQDSLLLLFDGGLAGESVPLQPLLVKQRSLDVVFAFDLASDSNENWPSGASLRSTYERQFTEQGEALICPHVPDTNTFFEKNMTARPSFFGCNSRNMTNLIKDGVVPPLVVYVANRPNLFFSNTSIFKLAYTDSDKKNMVRNGIEVATMMNGTFDSEWRTCVACAIVRREEERQGIEQLAQCQKCFSRYCWDGSYSSPNFIHKVNFTDTGLTNDPMELGVFPDKQPPYVPGILKRELEKEIMALEAQAKRSEASQIALGAWAVTLFLSFGWVFMYLLLQAIGQ